MLNPKLSKSKKLSKNRLTVQTPLHSLQYLQQQVCFISPWKKMDRRSEMPRSDRRHASTSPKILSASCVKHQLWSVRLINLNSIVTNSDMVLHKHVVVCLNYTISQNPRWIWKSSGNMRIPILCSLYEHFPYFHSLNFLYVSPLLDSAHILTQFSLLCIYT